MSIKRRKFARYLALTLLPALLVVLVAFVPAMLATGDSAEALSGSEWQTVAGSVDSYIASQHQYTDDGEAGFLIKGDALKSRLDSNNDGTILGEGDDAANSPVLVDVYTGTFIPGTALRFSNTTAADTANANQVAAEVTQHRNAGFSTDIVSYCLTGHTESPPVLAYGAMAQAGYFGSPAPKSLGLKWGRLGWGGTGGQPTYAGTGKFTASAAAAGSFALAGNTACAGSTPTAELVRCTAAGALLTVGNVTAIADANQAVDIRNTLTGGTLANTAGAVWAIQDPLNTLFNATGGTYDNLKKLDGSKTIVFINRSQHTAAFAATGAKMLGYTNAKYYKWGLPMWNSANPPGWQEKFSAATRGYDYPFTSAAIDTAAPTISGVSSGTPGLTNATITWNTNEPATSMVEYGTAPGGPFTMVNNTMLHAGHSVALSGLSQGTTYYFKVSSYDGLANGSSSSVASFTTDAPDTTAPSVGNVQPSGTISTASTTISADYSDADSGIDTASVVVTLDGTPLAGCTVNATNVSCAASGYATGAHTIGGSVADNAGNTATISGSFTYDNSPPPDTTAPTVGNVQPSGTISTASTTVSADYSDADSGINTSSVSVTLDGTPLAGCTATATQVSCAASGYAEGAHTIGGSVSDNAGNTTAISGGFTYTAPVVDTTAPSVSNVQPSGTISTSSTTVSADYSDAESGINTASVSVTLDGTPLSGCTATATGVSCPASGYAAGPHTIGGSVADNAGNTASISGSFTYTVPTGVAPSVSYSGPSGKQYSRNVVITATYADADGDVDTSSAKVSLNGRPDVPCSASGGQIRCNVSGLSNGHYEAIVSIADSAGRQGTATGSFDISVSKLELPLTSLERTISMLRNVPLLGGLLGTLLW